MEGDSRALNQHEVSAEVWMEAVGAYFLDGGSGSVLFAIIIVLGGDSAA